MASLASSISQQFCTPATFLGTPPPSCGNSLLARQPYRNVIGAIDGSHIRIPAPHYNYKQFYSIVLFAICDNRGMFRWFASGAPGSSGDSGIFQRCRFHRDILAEQLLPMDERVLIANGASILGDSAFAESSWLRTPITAASTRPECFFNYAHSSYRFRIEHSFGKFHVLFCVFGSCRYA